MGARKVTYALLCYEQEKFVRDAVRSALAQDLTPLEIIVSDDCSKDGTYEILEEEARGYKGPNDVVLNRNDSNLGIEHNNKAVQLAKGDLVILAHGDDIAVPHRARRIAEAWAEQRASVLSSNAWVMDAEARPLGLLCGETESRPITVDEILSLGWKKTMLGASLAVDREIFSEFNWLDRREIPVGTDHIFPFRGALLRGMYYVGEPLVYWRQHAVNVGDLIGDKSGGDLVFRETYLAYRIMRATGMLRDIVHLRRRMPENSRFEQIERALSLQIWRHMDQWIRLRNELFLEGKRPTWIDKSELAAKPIREDYRVWPDVKTSAIPDPLKIVRGE